MSIARAGWLALWVCWSVRVFAADSETKLAARLRDVFGRAGYKAIPTEWSWTGARSAPCFIVRHENRELRLLVDTLATNCLVRSKTANSYREGTGAGDGVQKMLLTCGDHSFGEVVAEPKEWSLPVKFKRPGGSIASLAKESPLYPIYDGLTPGPINGKIYVNIVAGSDFLRAQGIWLAFVGNHSFVPSGPAQTDATAQISTELLGLGYSKIQSRVNHLGAPCFPCRIGTRDYLLALASACGKTVFQDGLERQAPGGVINSNDNLFANLFAPNLPMRRWRLKRIEVGPWNEPNYGVGLSNLSPWGIRDSFPEDGVAGFLGNDVLRDACVLVHLASGTIFVKNQN